MTWISDSTLVHLSPMVLAENVINPSLFLVNFAK